MRSQETFNLIQSAKEIKVAIKNDGDRVGEQLNEQNPMPVGDGEPAFDYRRHLGNLSGQLDSAVDAVAVTEDAHAEQLIRVSRAQDERDEVATASYDTLVSTRQGLEGLYKSGGFEMVFVSGNTPRAPKRLDEQLGQSVKLLREPAVARRALKVKGFSVDIGEVADELDAHKTELRAALDRVEAANKAAEGTLVTKREAIDMLRRTIIWVGRTTEGLFHLAGEDELAKRIRTLARRPKRPSEKTEDPSPEIQA